MKIIKKEFILALILTFSISLIPVFASDLDDLQYLPYEDLGRPNETVQLINGAVTIEDGRYVACATASGVTAKFNVVDLETGNVLRSFDVVGETYWAHETDLEGNVYFAGIQNYTLYKYSPITKDLKSYTIADRAVNQIAIDENNNVYLATYPHAKIIKFSPNASQGQEFEDWGVQMTGTGVQSLAYHNGYLYAGGMANGDPDFYKININTKEKTSIAPPNGLAGKIESYYASRTIRDKIFIYLHKTEGENSFIILDTATDEFLDMELISPFGFFPTPEMDGYVYLSKASGEGSYRYKLDDNTYDTVSLNAGTIRGGGVVTLTNNANFPNKAFVNFNAAGTVRILDYTTSKIYVFPENLEPAGINLDAIYEFDGYIYTSAYMGAGGSVKYNPKTKSKELSFTMGQSTPIKKIGDKLYYGAYPNARLLVYDPALPVSATNPKELFSLQDKKQDRPMSIIEAEGKIIMGCVANYVTITGGFAIYDPISGEVEFVDAPENLGVTGLAYKDGFIYGSTTVYGGTNTTAVLTNTKLFKYNLSTKEMTSNDISVSGFPNIDMFGGLKFGADGRLWTIAQGLVLGLNPATGVAEKIIDISNYAYSGSRIWVPYGFDFNPDGFLYAAIRHGSNKGLYVIDIDTLEYKNIAPGLSDGIDFLAMSPDGGTIYTTAKDHLYRVRKSVPLIDGNEDIYISAEEEVYIDNGGKTISAPFRAVIAFPSGGGDYERVECGMLLSKRNLSKSLFIINNMSLSIIPARAVDANGNYGILFYGLSPGVTYYARAYAKYYNTKTQKTITVYGDIINKFLL